MIIRYFLAIVVALALGCGSAQHAVGPSAEALVSSPFPPPHDCQKRPDNDGKCTRPDSWQEEALIIARNGGCWVGIAANEAQCQAVRRESSYTVWAEGLCWFWMPTGRKRQPTSSSAEHLAPVTTR